MAKILVADDSNFMRQLLIGILNKAGFTEIIEASNGREALEKAESEKPDLILLDIIMPEVDGIEVLKKISPGFKILVVSAVGQDSVIEQAKKLGAKGYITKPFDSKKITEEIGALLG